MTTIAYIMIIIGAATVANCIMKIVEVIDR